MVVSAPLLRRPRSCTEQKPSPHRPSTRLLPVLTAMAQTHSLSVSCFTQISELTPHSPLQRKKFH